MGQWLVSRHSPMGEDNWCSLMSLRPPGETAFTQFWIRTLQECMYSLMSPDTRGDMPQLLCSTRAPGDDESFDESPRGARVTILFTEKRVS